MSAGSDSATSFPAATRRCSTPLISSNNLIDDPQTAIIGGFIETVRRPERFAAALDRAATCGKPVALIKVGARGAAATRYGPHTAARRQPRGYPELLATHRAIEVADLAELTEVLAASQGPRRPAGRRMGRSPRRAVSPS
jgi:acetyltransferase